MSETLTPARERKLLRARAVQIQRAIADVHLAVDDLPPTDQLLALNEVIADKLGELGISVQRGQQRGDHGQRQRAA